MRLAIAGTILATAFLITGANAQSPQPMVTGNKAFCLKDGTKFNCSFDSMAACEKDTKGTNAGAGAPACVARSEAK